MKIAMMTEVPLHYMDQESALRLIRDMGYDGVDISLLFTMNDDDEMIKGDYLAHAKHLRDVCAEIGLTPVQAHTPFPIHKEGNEAYNQKMLEVTKKCLGICGVLGIPYCVIHPWNNWNVQENKENWFSRLLPEAEKAHVHIATENMWNWDKTADRAAIASCSLPDDFLALCRAMDSPWFSACVDVGHANMFPFDPRITPRKMIETLGSEYVGCLHLHDNDAWHDLHQVPMTNWDNLNWAEVIQGLRDIGYAKDLVIETELPKTVPFEIAKASWIQQRSFLEWLRKQLGGK
jgi:sugar phosphate isomerase/epimerase